MPNQWRRAEYLNQMRSSDDRLQECQVRPHIVGLIHEDHTRCRNMRLENLLALLLRPAETMPVLPNMQLVQQDRHRRASQRSDRMQVLRVAHAKCVQEFQAVSNWLRAIRWDPKSERWTTPPRSMPTKGSKPSRVSVRRDRRRQ